MKAIATIATGKRMYGDMALNLALSIRASSDSIPIILYYTPSAVDGIEELIGRAFNACIELPNTDKPVELSFHTKLNILNILPDEVDEVILMDADTVILPGRRIKDWFEQLESVNFTAYCNDNFDFLTKTRKRKDYTFWCDPMEAFYLFPIPIENKMPMINASFIYFKVCEDVKKLFDKALEIWSDSKNLIFEAFRDCKTEELCLNIACAITGVMPHRVTFRPIFFQYQAENYSIEGIYHHYRALGLAGEIIHDPNILNLYNRCSAYYRGLNSIIPVFEVNQDMKGAKVIVDDEPIVIPILRRRTLYRAGELPNSEAGVFNYSSLIVGEKIVSIFRKESSFDAYKRYKKTTGIPHIQVGEKNSELKMIGVPDGVRLEDFRLICDTGIEILCAHSAVTNNHTEKMECKIVISTIENDEFHFGKYVDLGIKTQKIEKNWMFIFEDNSTISCIYSLNPYRIFNNMDGEIITESPSITEWFHKSYISSSTNPILIGNEYLMMFHSKCSSEYFHGMAIINKDTKQITHYTRHSINLPYLKHGFQPHVLYVSRLLYIEETKTLRICCGEADTSSVYYEMNIDDVMSEVKKYPS